jgi:hypothetical protein
MPNLWKSQFAGKLPDIFTQRYELGVSGKASSPSLSHRRERGRTASATASKTASGSLYLAQSDRAVCAAGYMGGQTLSAGAFTAEFPAFGNNFAACMLTSLDGAPITSSEHLLLTISGKSENLDMGWNDARTSVSNKWGHGPVQAETIPAAVTLANGKIGHVWALDPTGARVKEVPVTMDRGKATFAIGPDYATVWYEIAK